MLRFRRLAAALIVLLLAGCSAPSALPPAPVVTPTPEPVVPAPVPEPTLVTDPQAVQLPQEPFWGAPGTRVVDSDGQTLSYSYAPLRIRGRVTQPVRFAYGFYAFSLEGRQIGLAGLRYDMIGLFGTQDNLQPVLTLPYQTGQVWALESPTDGPKVTGFEQITTPAGSFATVVLNSGEWWSPGVGLVRTQYPGQPAREAARIERDDGQLVEVAARITPDLTAIVMDGGIYDEHGRQLADLNLPEGQDRRPSWQWRQIDGTPVLRHGMHSKAPPYWRKALWSYRPATGRFELVPWRFPDGSTRTVLSGSVNESAESWNGTAPVRVDFFDEEHYPRGHYVFTWKNGEMQTVSHRFITATGEQDFVRHLTQPLNEASWVGLFADPADGRKAYGAVYSGGRNLMLFGMAESGPPGEWVIRGFNGRILATVRLVKTEQDWRVSSFTIGEGLP